MKLNKLIMMMFIAFSITLTGCQSNEDEQHYDNKLFLSTTAFTQEILFKAGDTNIVKGLSVEIAKPETHDIKVTMAPAPELLDTYRSAYYDDAAILLPETHYVMEENKVTIKAGAVSSNILPIQFINTGELDADLTYVLPVTIQSAEGIEVLQSAKNYYYVFHGASLINVVCNLNENRAYPDFNNDARFNNMKENTLELLFKASQLKNEISTLMGIEGKYLLRIGDAGVPSNQLQLATSNGNLTNSDLQFDGNKWYHVAVTFKEGEAKIYIDGIEKASKNFSRLKTVSLGTKHSDESGGKARCFWIGYSYNEQRFFNGSVAEVRIWNRALTAEEIQAVNHFYTADPASEGLIAYWKFDEGEGQTVKANQPLGELDMTQLVLKKQQLCAGKDATTSRRLNTAQQVASLRQQITNLQSEQARFKALLKDGAATQKQVDDIGYQIATLQKQLAATDEQVSTANRSIDGQSAGFDAQIGQVDDMMQQAVITSPIDGVILSKYAETGEFAVPGRALFKIADVSDMKLRAYITADLLTNLKIGQKVKVYADQGANGRKEYEGTVSWISSEAEFTPKTIQTRDERSNLVYAVKITVRNDGLIKRGMYGDVKL